MPASRSRTHDWRKLLQQIYERGGAIEFAIAHPERGETDPSLHATGPDLVWRVKVQKLTEEEIGVEFPVTLGREVGIDVHIKDFIRGGSARSGKHPKRICTQGVCAISST